MVMSKKVRNSCQHQRKGEQRRAAVRHACLRGGQRIRMPFAPSINAGPATYETHLCFAPCFDPMEIAALCHACENHGTRGGSYVACASLVAHPCKL
eukprot:1159792-Pelagomonas_calceolata.AAC.20